jgi:hypothetical protein
MAHCDNVIGICTEPRLNDPLNKWIEEMKFGYNYALLRIPGGIKDLARPANPQIAEYWWENKIEGIYIGKLGASNFYFFGHNDCAEYPKTRSYQEDHRAHMEDLVTVSNQLHNRHPSFKIQLLFAHIIEPKNPQSPVEISEIR